MIKRVIILSLILGIWVALSIGINAILFPEKVLLINIYIILSLGLLLLLLMSRVLHKKYKKLWRFQLELLSIRTLLFFFLSLLIVNIIAILILSSNTIGFNTDFLFLIIYYQWKVTMIFMLCVLLFYPFLGPFICKEYRYYDKKIMIGSYLDFQVIKRSNIKRIEYKKLKPFEILLSKRKRKYINRFYPFLTNDVVLVTLEKTKSQEEKYIALPDYIVKRYEFNEDSLLSFDLYTV